ncbi:Peptidase M16 OS=Lysinibacillus sphaericus OX=1421 GN=LS41612_17575 PE=3 SV=1 [Lysinibacillus sphaericus]
MSEDAPDDDVHEKLWEVMYPNDALGRPILGNAATLKTFTADMIRNYMAKHYEPESIVISVAGNISPTLLTTIEDLFGRYEASPLAVVPVLTNPQFHPGEITKTRDTEQAHLALSYPAIGVKDPDMYSFIALNNIIGGNMSSRLFQEVREERGLAYTIFSYQSCYADVGAFTIYGSASRQQLSQLQHTIDATLLDIVAGGVTEEELDNAKEQLKGSFVLGLEGTGARMNRNGTSELVHRRHRSVDEVLASIDAVTMESVIRLISKILKAEPAISIIGT